MRSGPLQLETRYDVLVLYIEEYGRKSDFFFLFFFRIFFLVKNSTENGMGISKICSMLFGFPHSQNRNVIIPYFFWSLFTLIFLFKPRIPHMP